MEVNRIENPQGILIRVEFTKVSEKDLKEELAEWIQANYPDWGYQGFYERLITFQGSRCALSIKEGD